MKEVSKEKLEQYFAITKKALQQAKVAPSPDKQRTEIILDMASRYVSDAEHFEQQGNWVLAFAALNYAHGWLDCGARLEFFTVDDDQLFTVDRP